MNKVEEVARAMSDCSIKGCDAPSYGRGWCQRHYLRWYRHGEPTALKQAAYGAPLKFIRSALVLKRDECLIWPYAKDLGGYGRIAWKGKVEGTNRLVCLLAHGEPPAGKNDAAHSCGVRACVNPRHLRWATRSENFADMDAHGTKIKGAAVWNTKLNDQNVLDICKRLDAGERKASIARLYGVTASSISSINRGINWDHLTNRSARPCPNRSQK